EEFRRLIREIQRVPVERSTLYATLRRFDDPAEDPPSLEDAKPLRTAGPRRVRARIEAARTAG
ncbi:MAG: hypothetical protein VCB78_12340, partial [Myxococcota bacterium]